MVKSIFELEKRTDIKKETLRIEKYLNEHRFYSHRFRSISFWVMVDEFFEYWPYRHTATTINDFFDLINVPITVNLMDEEECFYYLQFIVDFIMWISLSDHNLFNKENEYLFFDLYKDNSDAFSTILKNISLIAQLENYKIEKIDDHYTFIKRDSDVDSVLKQLENEEDVRIALLSYNDFRIEKNINDKMIILKMLGDWLEPQRSIYSEINSKLTNDIFYILNVAKIRHNNNKQLDLDDDSLISLYDNLFKMIIHLIRSQDINKIQLYVQKLKQ